MKMMEGDKQPEPVPEHRKEKISHCCPVREYTDGTTNSQEGRDSNDAHLSHVSGIADNALNLQTSAECSIHEAECSETRGCAIGKDSSPSDLMGSQGDNSSCGQCSASNETADARPRGVPEHLWQKFQHLQQRRQKVSKPSTDKRIQKIQKQAFDKVSQELHRPEDRAVLHRHDISLPGNPSKDACNQGNNLTADKQEPDAGSPKKRKQSSGKSQAGAISPAPGDNNAAGWQGIRNFLGINDHLKGMDRGKYEPKSNLEEKIDEAISLGDYDTAERLNNQLANREFACRITEAIDARRYDQKKRKEEEVIRTKKKKKLDWGFGHKERWETKSNM